MADNGTPRVRALIVDDEELGRRMLRSLLAADEDVQVVGEAASAAEARRKISEHQPDLVFMDVEMPGGNGIEVLQDIDEPVPYVILVTAHPEFALPAFEAQVVRLPREAGAAPALPRQRDAREAAHRRAPRRRARAPDRGRGRHERQRRGGRRARAQRRRRSTRTR